MKKQQQIKTKYYRSLIRLVYKVEFGCAYTCLSCQVLKTAFAVMNACPAAFTAVATSWLANSGAKSTVLETTMLAFKMLVQIFF